MEATRSSASYHRVRVLDAVVSLILLTICAVAYRKVTRLWWMWDDPYHLNRFATTSFSQLFFSSSFWHAYPAHVYTPLQLVSLKADEAMFALNAQGFYVHQLIAIMAGAIVLYVATRLALDPISAGAVTLLAVLGPAFAKTAPQLMTRHYFEGLVFATAAFIAFARERPALSGVLYFVSTLAKEVFVPLPLLLVALYPKRWRQLLSHGGALFVYTIMRIAILGPAQGYGYTVPTRLWPMAIATAPVRVFRTMVSDSGSLGLCLVIAVLLSVAILFFTESNQRIVIAAAAVASIAPILPVSIDMQSRYAMLAWLLACVAAGLLLKRFTVILLVLALLANRAQWSQTMRESTRMSEEARAFSRMSATDLLFMPLTPPATMMELRTLTGSTARWSYDQQPLCMRRLPARRILGFDARSRTVRDVEPPKLASICAAIRAAPLSMTLTGAGDRLFWTFGPYRDGNYSIILGDGLQGFSVPRDVGFRLGDVGSLALRVRYDSPAGWSTYSPDVTIDLKHSQKIVWHR